MTIQAENGLVMRISKAQEEDEEICAIRRVLETDGDYQNYFLKNNILYKFESGRELLVVPRAQQMEIIRLCHERNHFGKSKVEEIVRQDYYIPKLAMKVKKSISNCVTCILANRKRGKQEGFLNPIPKEAVPLQTYHIDHLGPLESTNKNYRYILAIIDSFTKFVWLYPTKTCASKETIDKLRHQQKIFGNPAMIISDRGTAFTSQDFKEYCSQEGIEHHCVTAGLPRANGQVERLNSVIISLLTKLSENNPARWYKYVDRVQRAINSTVQRSTGYTPFHLLVGVKMRNKEDVNLKELLEDEMKANFDADRNEFREDAKRQLLKLQEENRRSFNRRRRPSMQYRIDDLVAVKRTQLGPGLKLKLKYFGPYKITKVKPNSTYDVVKVGSHEGPGSTTTCAEFMKPWPTPFQDEDEEGLASETDCQQDGRVVGTYYRAHAPHRTGTRETERVSQCDM